MVIAIDGPSGVGKSTVARAVAAALGFPYLDTGATYRAATVAALRAGANPADADAVLAAVRAAVIEYDSTIYLDGEPVGVDVRTPAVTASVSAVSAHPQVRDVIVAMQREWVDRRGGDAVVEGRDIGTVVFPDAAVKVFLTARPEIRAMRRAGDAEAAGSGLSEIAADLAARDHADSTREVSPLSPAPDAVVVDTSDLSIDAVVAVVLELAGEAGSG